ncbi:hypothetical protein C9374_002920 [Naegleria lovaniensis]|uniref:Uncharacterized protein n=1 Tax=Naegleria lovaniensis TaxID=51637 RepID=A0AA88GP79_NAELO|nr:uncharacterized protein C9374_002920 [Naegleria lovaniensis]KAG2385771.1 hypothetical protein C9374_002920 [Naegleria lovaniensis]
MLNFSPSSLQNDDGGPFGSSSNGYWTTTTTGNERDLRSSTKIRSSYSFSPSSPRPSQQQQQPTTSTMYYNHTNPNHYSPSSSFQGPATNGFYYHDDVRQPSISPMTYQRVYLPSSSTASQQYSTFDYDPSGVSFDPMNNTIMMGGDGVNARHTRNVMFAPSEMNPNDNTIMVTHDGRPSARTTSTRSSFHSAAKTGSTSSGSNDMLLWLQSLVSKILRPLIHYLFSYRIQNIHKYHQQQFPDESTIIVSSPTPASSPAQNREINSIDKITFTIGAGIFFTIFSLVTVQLYNSIFAVNTKPLFKRGVFSFVMGEVCITLLLVIMRFVFALDNADYDPSVVKQRQKIPVRDTETPLLFDYFTLDEREIMFFMSTICTFIISYTNALIFSILFELTLVIIGSHYGFLNKSLLGVAVTLLNFFEILLRWLNLRENYSVEILLSLACMTMMLQSWRLKKLRTFKAKNYPSSLARFVAFYCSEEMFFLLPKALRVCHILYETSKFSIGLFWELVVLSGIGIIGSILIFKILQQTNFYLVSDITQYERVRHANLGNVYGMPRRRSRSGLALQRLVSANQNTPSSSSSPYTRKLMNGRPFTTTSPSYIPHNLLNQ